MVTLTADDTTLLKDVGIFVEPVEVYDPRGRLLGLFVPANLERGKQLLAQLPQLFDREELKRRLSSGEKGITHDEMWGRIRRLEAERQRRGAAGEGDFTPEEAVAYVRTLREQAQAGRRRREDHDLQVQSRLGRQAGRFLEVPRTHGPHQSADDLARSQPAGASTEDRRIRAAE